MGGVGRGTRACEQAEEREEGRSGQEDAQITQDPPWLWVRGEASGCGLRRWTVRGGPGVSSANGKTGGRGGGGVGGPGCLLLVSWLDLLGGVGGWRKSGIIPGC